MAKDDSLAKAQQLQSEMRESIENLKKLTEESERLIKSARKETAKKP